MFNATITGRLTRDVEKTVYNAKTGAILVRSCMAIKGSENKTTGQTNVTFVDIVAFGDIADYLASYGKKGNGFMMVGDCELQEYQRKDGTTNKSLNMTVNKCEIFSNLHADELRRQQQAANGGYVDQPKKVSSTPIQEANQDIQQTLNQNGFEISDDDLPF